MTLVIYMQVSTNRLLKTTSCASYKLIHSRYAQAPTSVQLIHSSSICDNSHHQPRNHDVLPRPSPRHDPPGHGFCPSKWPGPAASTGNGTSTIRLWRRPLPVERRGQARRVRRPPAGKDGPGQQRPMLSADTWDAERRQLSERRLEPGICPCWRKHRQESRCRAHCLRRGSPLRQRLCFSCTSRPRW